MSTSRLTSSSTSSVSHDHNGTTIFIPEGDDLQDSAAKKPRSRKKKRPSSSWKHKKWRHLFLQKASHGWPLILTLALIIILFLEVRMHLHSSGSDSEHNNQHPEPASQEIHNVKQDIVEKESNLDKLDMPTRVVAGVREACLKLLPWDDISSLTFPPPTVSPIKIIHYKTWEFQLPEDNLSDSVENQLLQPGLTRNILFAGNQTMDERDQSYKVHEVMEVHCGFCRERGVFDIEHHDKVYMAKCQAVVITCTFGGSDDLYQPINTTEATFSKVCFVAFWDEVTLEMHSIEGKKKDDNGKIGHWYIVVVQNLPFADQRLNGKIPKMLGHRLFPNARYSIWVDSKSQFRRDAMGVFEALLWRVNSVFAISEHGARDCVYAEGDAIVKKHKATPEEVAIQLQQYRVEGFPERARFDNHKALAEASVIVREHTALTNLFMCLWFNEVVRFTARDQLSFPYVLKHLGILHINMFPVCTRKALVNSLHHLRKAKPLISTL